MAFTIDVIQVKTNVLLLYQHTQVPCHR